MGWCVQENWFQSQPTDCCSRRSGKFDPQISYLSCFVPFLGDPLLADGRCVNPVPVMTPSDHEPPVLRCSQTQDCEADASTPGQAMQCIVPDVGVHLTRISVGPPISRGQDHDPILTKVVLWSGPKSEIWDEVSVGILAPSSQFLPLFLPGLVSLFFEYLATLSLSLYLFNLFCLPFLDGSLFFSALLDSIGGAREPDEDMSPDVELSHRSDRWLQRDSEDRYSLDSELESGTIELPRGYTSPPPLQYSNAPHSAHKVIHILWRAVRRCRWEIRYRKGTIELVVRVATIGLISFVIMGMVWTQQWKGI